MIRVLVVDDSVVARRSISLALERDKSIEVVGTATDGAVALKKIKMLNPDLVVMDVNMPEMDGITALKHLKKDSPELPVIMFSSITEAGTTIEALEIGAADFVEKPSGARDIEEGIMLVFSSLVPKIKAICQVDSKGGAQNVAPPSLSTPTGFTPAHTATTQTPTPPAVNGSKNSYTPSSPGLRSSVVNKPVMSGNKRIIPESPRERRRSSRPLPIEVVAIGVSTGGPKALARLMPTIPADFPVPIVIVQHMPPIFTQKLAQRLDEASEISIYEGAVGDVIKPGGAWIAPGGYHMYLEKKGIGEVAINTHTGPLVEGCRPAVNVLFESVAEIYGANTLAVILTGMGKDGLEGSKLILNEGGRLLAQDEASSVVWGMPGAVTRAGLPEKVAHIDELGFEIVSRVKNTRLLQVENRF